MATDSRKKLSELGINSTFYESKDTFHEWHTWRRCLNEFAPLLFKLLDEIFNIRIYAGQEFTGSNAVTNKT